MIGIYLYFVICFLRFRMQGTIETRPSPGYSSGSLFQFQQLDIDRLSRYSKYLQLQNLATPVLRFLGKPHQHQQRYWDSAVGGGEF